MVNKLPWPRVLHPPPPPCHFLSQHHVRYRHSFICPVIFPHFLFLFPPAAVTRTSLSLLKVHFVLTFFSLSTICKHFPPNLRQQAFYSALGPTIWSCLCCSSFIYQLHKHTAATKTHRHCCYMIAMLTLSSGTFPPVNMHVCSQTKRCLLSYTRHYVTGKLYFIWTGWKLFKSHYPDTNALVTLQIREHTFTIIYHAE